MTASARNLGLDALRGLAVVLMVQQHLGAWLTRLTGPSGFVGDLLLALNWTGGAAAPLFVTVAGVGVAFASTRISERQDRHWLRRGVVLLGVAYALNALTPRWFTLGSFYVLHLIAVFWLLVPILRRLPNAALLGMSALILALAVWGQNACHTPPLLSNTSMREASGPFGTLRLALLEGHFPLLPWLGFALAGLVGGRLWLDGRPWTLAQLSGVSLSLGLVLRLLANLRPRLLREVGLQRAVAFSFYPATTAFVLLLVGLSLALVLLALSLGMRISARSRWVALGRLSLTIFAVHVVLFRQWAPTVGLSNNLSPAESLGAIALTLTTLAWLARLWSSKDYRFSLEWVLSRLTAGRPGQGGVHPVAPPGPPPGFH